MTVGDGDPHFTFHGAATVRVKAVRWGAALLFGLGIVLIGALTMAALLWVNGQLGLLIGSSIGLAGSLLAMRGGRRAPTRFFFIGSLLLLVADAASLVAGVIGYALEAAQITVGAAGLLALLLDALFLAAVSASR